MGYKYVRGSYSVVGVLFVDPVASRPCWRTPQGTFNALPSSMRYGYFSVVCARSSFARMFANRVHVWVCDPGVISQQRTRVRSESTKKSLTG